jgi:tetratricopeptide (TPR) repeat protein
MLRYHQARHSGSFDVACAALEDVLRMKQRRPAAAIANDVVDYALDHLVALYFEHHHDAAAASVLDRFLPMARDAFSIGLRAARIYDRHGETEKALRAVRDALRSNPDDPASRLKAAAALLEIGAFDEARALYDALLDDVPRGAPATPVVEALAQLALWRGDIECALRHADGLVGSAADGAAKRIRAAGLVLRGDYAGALALLDAVLAADPEDGEAHLWRSETLLRLGDRANAAAAADRSRRYGYSFAAGAIHLLAALPPPEARDSAPTVPGQVDGAVFHAEQELKTELTALVPAAAELLSTPMTVGQLGELLEHALAVLQGNRNRLATWVRPDGTLARVPPTGAARMLSRDAFELIRVGAIGESFRRLDALAARFPDSSMPVVHRGELHLWLGNYAEARTDLERAIAIRRRTRWAWYGLAWLEIVTGDFERGLATCAEGIAVMGDGPYPPAFACLGEAYRRLGRLDDAREQLETACERAPTRLSAWVDLALVHGATGEHAQQAAVFAKVARLAPALVSHAANELGEDVFTAVVLAAPFGEDVAAAGVQPAMLNRVLEHVLVMMRGNRASGLVTYFTADGRFHHVPRYGGQQSSPEAARHAVDKVRGVLRRALEAIG